MIENERENLITSETYEIQLLVKKFFKLSNFHLRFLLHLTYRILEKYYST